MKHLLVNSESRFVRKLFQLTTFGFKKTKLRGEPGCRGGKEDRTCFEGGE